MTAIHTPTREELERRVSRYSELKEMTTREKELKGISQDAVDIIFARKIMPVILDDTKNPFGSYAPIIGAARSTMFISILPPGQGPACTRTTAPTRHSSCWRGASNTTSASPSRTGSPSTNGTRSPARRLSIAASAMSEPRMRCN